MEELFGIFPQCRDSYQPIHDEPASFHSALIAFSPLVTAALNNCSKADLLRFAELVNSAVESGGVLENAFATCLLEHLGQLGASNTLRPYLSRLAREKANA